MSRVHGTNGVGNYFGNKDALKSKNIKGHQFEGKVRDHLKSSMHYLRRMWPGLQSSTVPCRRRWRPWCGGMTGPRRPHPSSSPSFLTGTSYVALRYILHKIHTF